MKINRDDRVEVSTNDRRYCFYKWAYFLDFPTPLVVGRMLQEFDVTTHDMIGDRATIDLWGPEVDMLTDSPDLETETISRIELDLSDRAEERDWEELGWDYLDEVVGEGWGDDLLPDDLLEALDEHEDDSSSQ